MTTELPEPASTVDGCVATGNYNDCCRGLRCTRRTDVFTAVQMLAFRDKALEEAMGKAHIALLGCDRDLTVRVVTAINSLKEVQS